MRILWEREGERELHAMRAFLCRLPHLLLLCLSETFLLFRLPGGVILLWRDALFPATLDVFARPCRRRRHAIAFVALMTPCRFFSFSDYPFLLPRAPLPLRLHFSCLLLLLLLPPAPLPLPSLYSEPPLPVRLERERLGQEGVFVLGVEVCQVTVRVERRLLVLEAKA